MPDIQRLDVVGEVVFSEDEPVQAIVGTNSVAAFRARGEWFALAIRKHGQIALVVGCGTQNEV